MGLSCHDAAQVDYCWGHGEVNANYGFFYMDPRHRPTGRTILGLAVTLLAIKTGHFFIEGGYSCFQFWKQRKIEHIPVSLNEDQAKEKISKRKAIEYGLVGVVYLIYFTLLFFMKNYVDFFLNYESTYGVVHETDKWWYNACIDTCKDHNCRLFSCQ